VGQGFAPAPNSGGLASNNAPPVLGRNPETYGNYMVHQQNARISDIQNNTPDQAINNIGQLMQPNQIQPSTITGYMPTQLPSVSGPQQPNKQQPNNGLSSLLPGQGGFS
tara:strand:+ start:7013 stop:7339 length:327 start_codon:yes stop_codon:yes gene_type:complete